MKKIFTLMWAIVCAALTIVSCTPDNGDDNNGGVVSASKITVTGAPEANLTPAAGELSLGYAIENPTLTDALVVTTEAAWVKVGEIGEATVALTYEANTDAPGSPAREAVIKFAYNGAEDVLVTLKQDSQAPSFEIEWLNVTCGSAQYTCTPADNEMLYLLASTQDLGQYGVQGETPQELMKNYAEMLATYGMLTGEADGWFVFKGATTEMPKDASRFNAEDTVSVFALGISVTVGEVDPETSMPTITVDHLTPVHAWEVPFLPYPTVTVPEAQLTNNVSSAAGELVLDCVLENALTDGSEVTLTTEATWVHPTWADNKLTIAYDANTVAVARRAKIAVQYGYWTNPFEVTLVQEKDATATAITLNLTVKGTQFNGILVDIVPSDENVVYALNYTTPEKDWETGAELPIDWMAKAEELLGYVGNTTFHKGTLTNHLIKTNVSNYEWNGLDYYVYAIPVALAEVEGAVEVSQILGETAVSEKVTIDVSKMPKLEWDVEKSGLTWNENNGRYDLEVVEGSTVVLHYILTNPVEGASVKLNGNSLYDSYNVVDGEPVIDNAAKTITFKIDKFDTAKKYHYVSPGFKYTNEAEDMWGITTPSLRLTQVEDPGMQLPYQESFAESIGNFTINNVSLDGLESVWSWNTYKYMKASAYVSSVKHATESWLVSPKIDLSAATMPGLQFSHTHKFAGTPSEELTLWVKEYGAAEWTQVTIPTYGTNNDWTFVTAAVDLSAWAGKKVQIGFKYVSSTSAAATWEIKDVVVYDAGGAAAPLM